MAKDNEDEPTPSVSNEKKYNDSSSGSNGQSHGFADSMGADKNVNRSLDKATSSNNASSAKDAVNEAKDKLDTRAVMDDAMRTNLGGDKTKDIQNVMDKGKDLKDKGSEFVAGKLAPGSDVLLAAKHNHDKKKRDDRRDRSDKRTGVDTKDSKDSDKNDLASKNKGNDQKKKKDDDKNKDQDDAAQGLKKGANTAQRGLRGAFNAIKGAHVLAKALPMIKTALVVGAATKGLKAAFAAVKAFVGGLFSKIGAAISGAAAFVAKNGIGGTLMAGIGFLASHALGSVVGGVVAVSTVALVSTVYNNQTMPRDDGMPQCQVSKSPTNANGINTASGDGSQLVTSREDWVKQHKDAFIEGWGKYGFLPSASIAQAIVETSLDTSVPSFGQAHNVGGVKWVSGMENYDTAKSGDMKSSGPGTGVGDGTGGGYAWFSSYDAGIIGKAEFVNRNSNYAGAVNNTDTDSTLKAIAAGGWATAPSYSAALLGAAHGGYGVSEATMKEIDKEAIKKYGEHPAKSHAGTSNAGTNSVIAQSAKANDCKAGSDNGDSVDGTGAVSEKVDSRWKEGDLPDDVKKYVHDPKEAGLGYGSSTGWFNPGGQCVHFSSSYFHAIWQGSPKIMVDAGKNSADMWAKAMGGEVNNTPHEGAIYSMGGAVPNESTPGPYGHTGMVLHVLANGDILVAEQNMPGYSGDDNHTPNTWDYHLIAKEKYQKYNFKFFTPDKSKYKLSWTGGNK